MARFTKTGLPRPYDEYNTYDLKSESMDALVKEYGYIRKKVMDNYRLAQKKEDAKDEPTGWRYLKNVSPGVLKRTGSIAEARQALIQAAEAYQSPLSSVSGIRKLREDTIETLERRGVNFANIKVNGRSVDVRKDFKQIMKAVDAAIADLGGRQYSSKQEIQLIQAFANAAAVGISADRIIQGPEHKGRLYRIMSNPDRVLTQKEWRKLK